MRSMSLDEFSDLLRGCSRCQFVSVTAVTVPQMRKRRNPRFGRVAKISHVSGAINWRYARVVNRQRAREGKRQTFEAVPRVWGTRLRQCPLVRHEAALYLEVKVQNRRERFIDTEQLVEIPPEQLTDFLPTKRPAGRQDLSQSIELRDYRLDNIGELKIAGEVWAVRPMSEQLHSYLEALSAAPGADKHPLTVEAAS